MRYIIEQSTGDPVTLNDVSTPEAERQPRGEGLHTCYHGVIARTCTRCPQDFQPRNPDGSPVAAPAHDPELPF